MARSGERKTQILQTLAQMLEGPSAERITTAALAAQIGVSEAALYRHFRGKADMFAGLIDFIEGTLFTLINRITSEEQGGLRQAEAIIGMLLGFAQKNRGITRVLTGDALVTEDSALQARVNQIHDRVEAALKQALRIAASRGETAPDVDVAAQANLLMSFVAGRWHQYAKSGFRRDPAEYWPQQWKQLTAGVAA
jgi:TetR/AcrR family transcriptional regulator